MWYPAFSPRGNSGLTARIVVAIAVLLTPLSRNAIASRGQSVAACNVCCAGCDGAETVIPKWRSSAQRPIRLWIGDGDGVEGWDSTFAAHATASFQSWADAAALSFEVVADSATADVRVVWTDLVIDSGGERVSGLTRAHLSNESEITAAEVWIAVKRPDGRALSQDAIAAIALHEAGHVIGLAHSSDSSSTMFPTVEVLGLSRADVEAARRLYQPRPRMLAE
jgi:hypothetical protein